MTVPKNAKKYAVTRRVPADEVKRTTAIDLLAWNEEKVLTELVREVYKAGYVGLSWPEIERVPFARVMGRTTELTPDLLELYEPSEWFVRAHVTAVPSPARILDMS